MSAQQRLLVLVEPSLLDGVARYVAEPRKRESIALGLAARVPGSTGDPERTVQRAAGIAARLDGALSLRSRALDSGSEQDASEYARRIWSEVALLAATLGPSWGEGVGRSLGLLAHPERFTGQPAPAAVRHLSRAVRHLLASTADAVPELALPGAERALPAWGGDGLASGYVPAEFTDWLALLLSGDRWPLEPLAVELFGARAAAAWRDNARRAARAAARNGCHLMEVDLNALRAQRASTPPARRRSTPPPAAWTLDARVA